MARRRYPSDDRPYFRLLTEVLRDPKLNVDCPARVAWAYVRLLAMLQQAGSRDGKITLDWRSICFCTRRTAIRHADKILREVEARGLCTLRPVGVHSESTRSALGVHSESTPSPLGVCYECAVPKWAEIQGFAPVKRGEEKRGEKRRGPDGVPPAAAAPQLLPGLEDVEFPKALTEGDQSRLLTVISRLPGSKAKKASWLSDNALLIAAEIDKGTWETPKARNAALVALVCRWWNHEEKNPGRGARGAESFEKQKSRELDAWNTSTPAA